MGVVECARATFPAMGRRRLPREAVRVVFVRFVAMNPLETQPYSYLLRGHKYGSSISMTHWYTGNEVPANVHTLGFSGAAMTSPSPAVELMLLIQGYRVSQAIHV